MTMCCAVGSMSLGLTRGTCWLRQIAPPSVRQTTCLTDPTTAIGFPVSTGMQNLNTVPDPPTPAHTCVWPCVSFQFQCVVWCAKPQRASTRHATWHTDTHTSPCPPPHPAAHDELPSYPCVHDCARSGCQMAINRWVEPHLLAAEPNFSYKISCALLAMPRLLHERVHRWELRVCDFGWSFARPHAQGTVQGGN